MKSPTKQEVKDFQNYCVVLTRFDHTFQFNFDSFDEAYAELKKLVSEESSYCILMGFKSIVGMYSKLPTSYKCEYQIKLEGLS